MESGIGYGLSAAQAGSITLKDGAVEQSNFHDYPVVRMNQMPRIETVIVPSQEEADRGRRALDARDRAGARRRVLWLNGKPVRALPLSAQGITFA